MSNPLVAEAKRYLQHQCSTNLYTLINRELVARLDRIIADNALRHKNNNPYMVYRGIVYYSTKAIRPLGFPLPVHPSLRPEMKEWLAERAHLEEEKQTVKIYLLAAMSLTMAPENLKILIPDSLHTYIDETYRIYGARINQTAQISEEELQEFMERNKEYYQLIKRRMTLNLIER